MPGLSRFVRALLVISVSLCCVAELPASVPSEGRYKINAGQSRFTVRALVGGLLSAVAGHDHTIAIRDFYGTAQFTYGSVTPASLQFTAKADSLAVTDKVSDSDRNQIQATMRNEVLDVNSYPEMTFKSTGITATRLEEGKYETRISGDLTLHGTTRPLTINAVSGRVVPCKVRSPLMRVSYLPSSRRVAVMPVLLKVISG